MRKPVLIVIAGPNGSGRTIDGKFAKQYVNSLPGWADRILRKSL